MASVGSAVYAVCVAVREIADALEARHEIASMHLSRREAYREIVAGSGGQPVEAEASSAPGDMRRQYSMHAFGAVFAEVAIDPDLPMVRMRRVVGAYAAGRIVNPRLARSQCNVLELRPLRKTEACQRLSFNLSRGRRAA